MSVVHHQYSIRCSVCLEDFDLRRTRPALSARPLKTHDVYQCPHCGYLVAIGRAQLLA